MQTKRTQTFSLTADFGHPTATVEPAMYGRAGVQVKFPNEWVVSVQWGPGTYSDNQQRWDVDFNDSTLTSETAEIAAWQGDTGMIEWPDGDTVQGWKTWEDVQVVLDRAERGDL